MNKIFQTKLSAFGQFTTKGMVIVMDIEKTSETNLTELSALKKQPLTIDAYDTVFALFVFILGYIFSRRVLFSWQGWSVSVFTALYLISVWLYAAKKGYSFKNSEALFWSVITFLTGFSYALWDGHGLMIRSLFLFCGAVYFVLTVTNKTIAQSTSNFIMADVANVFIFIPFRNFLNQLTAVFAPLHRRKDTLQLKKKLPALLGVLIAVIMLAWLIPLLLKADSGGFGRIVNTFGRFFNTGLSIDSIFYFVVSLPVSAYIFGLVSGAVHDRNAATITYEHCQKTSSAIRVLQPATIYIATGAICVLYAVFVFSQLPYFFSAFTGLRPDGWVSYSEFAREGFFELCRIAVINLLVMTAGNVMCVKKPKELPPLRILNVLLSSITMLLIVTAMGKMALYIETFGLSMPRLLPFVFMVFLMIVFSAIIILQKREFSIVRVALATGAVMFCVLCLVNPDALVVRYNTDRYLAGTLTDYDVDILYRAGAAGVIPALEVYESRESDYLKAQIGTYLRSQRTVLSRESFFWESSVESYAAGKALISRNPAK